MGTVMQAFNNLHYEHHLHTYPAKSSKTVQSRSIVYLSNINRWTILVLYNFTVFCQEMHSCNYGVQNKPWEPLVLIHLLSDWLLITSIVYYILPMWGHVTRWFLSYTHSQLHSRPDGWVENLSLLLPPNFAFIS